MESPSPAFFVSLGCYIVAAVAFTAVFASERRWIKTLAWGALLAGFVAHGSDISWRATQDFHPGTSVREALGFIGWIVALVYIVFGGIHKLHPIGAFVVPVVMGLLVVARLTPASPDVGHTTIMRVHIALASIGVAVFGIATAVATTYLLKDRSLKRKNFDGFWFRRGASLDVLDRVENRLVLLGFPIFSIAVMLGVVSAAQAGVGFSRPEYPFALVTWLAYGGVAVARTTHGWRGRKASWAIIGGFFASVVVLSIYLLRGLL